MAAISRSFIAALASATLVRRPFSHWLLRNALPADVAPALEALPLMPPGSDTGGRRETHNAERTYCGVVNRRRFPVCDYLARAFQSRPLIQAIKEHMAIELAGSLLRIEYCQDTDGFWLEPHTDIGAKRLTILVYLSSDPASSNWGTDLYDEEGHLAGRAPYAFNAGVAFIPGKNTWHGFEPRPIVGIRRSLIVNYVVPDWRSRHELAFPDRPIGTRARRA
ncbi:MAG: 2OG-Fe(II) oxygenase [Alphaproteobacteria bacterium]|nr:2OG-Fe(II) oxygenase [Alphaproteobacteria bacterium]